MIFFYFVRSAVPRTSFRMARTSDRGWKFTLRDNDPKAHAGPASGRRRECPGAAPRRPRLRPRGNVSGPENQLPGVLTDKTNAPNPKLDAANPAKYRLEELNCGFAGAIISLANSWRLCFQLLWGLRGGSTHILASKLILHTDWVSNEG